MNEKFKLVIAVGISYYNDVLALLPKAREAVSLLLPLLFLRQIFKIFVHNQLRIH